MRRCGSVDADPMFRRVLGDGVVGRLWAASCTPASLSRCARGLPGWWPGQVNRVTCHTVLLRNDHAPVIVEFPAVPVAPLRGPAGIALAVCPEDGRRTFDPLTQPVRFSELSARILDHVAAGMSSAQPARRFPQWTERGVPRGVAGARTRCARPHRNGVHGLRGRRPAGAAVAAEGGSVHHRLSEVRCGQRLHIGLLVQSVSPPLVRRRVHVRPHRTDVATWTTALRSFRKHVRRSMCWWGRR